MSKKPVRVAVTGAAGQIGYALLFRIASGEMLGKDQPVILQLLEIPDEKAQKALKGVMMELEDCAFPLLAGMEAHSDADTAFKDTDYALLVGARPRGPGMERADLLAANAQIFTAPGQGAGRRGQPQRQGAGGRQPGQHQRLHRDEERARPAARELHRDAAPGPQPRRSARSPPRPASRWPRSRSWRCGATTRRRMYADYRFATIDGASGQGHDQRPGLEQGRVPAHRGQARRGDHRGARPVVGRLGRQRRHRPHARLGAGHRRRMGDDGRAQQRRVRHPEGRDVRLPGHPRRRRVQDRRRPADRRLQPGMHRQDAGRAAGRAGRRQAPAADRGRRQRPALARPSMAARARRCSRTAEAARRAAGVRPLQRRRGAHAQEPGAAGRARAGVRRHARRRGRRTGRRRGTSTRS